jgi:hypothetical protein
MSFILTRMEGGKLYDFRPGLRREAWRRGVPGGKRPALGLSVSGSDQAREGRLVDALAARGDEGRDTLR